MFIKQMQTNQLHMLNKHLFRNVYKTLQFGILYHTPKTNFIISQNLRLQSVYCGKI